MSAGGKICEACGRAFVCDIAAGKSQCWCFHLPAVMPVKDADGDCLCETCLKKRIDEKLKSGFNSAAGQSSSGSG